MNLAVGPRTYAYARLSGSAGALVILNSGDRPETLEFSAAPLRLPAVTTALADRLGHAEVKVEAGRIRARLPARAAALCTFARR